MVGRSLWRTVLAATGCAVLLAGCGGSHTITGTASSCGPAYILRIGRASTSDGCAGAIPAGHPLAVTIAMHRRFSLLIGHEAGGVLDFPIPVSANGHVRELARHGAAITYMAEHPGTVGLIAHHTIYCNLPGPRYQSCTVAVVTVTRS